MDDFAPTAEIVMERFPAEAKKQWGIEYETYPAPSELQHEWAKYRNEDELIGCAADDPDRDSEWWKFALSDEKARV